MPVDQFGANYRLSRKTEFTLPVTSYLAMYREDRSMLLLLLLLYFLLGVINEDDVGKGQHKGSGVMGTCHVVMADTPPTRSMPK